MVRFDLSGVAHCKTGYRLHWLVLERSGVDVCLKDPGHPVDAVVTGPIGHLVQVYLGRMTWRQAMTSGLSIEGDRDVEHNLESWMRLDRVVGRDLPVVPSRGGVTRDAQRRGGPPLPRYA